MTSEPIFVWAWLPGSVEPVVAGRVDRGTPTVFTYGRSYLERPDAIPIGPELPLRPGPTLPAAGLSIAGCLADAAPDAWGRRVIMWRRFGTPARDRDTGELDIVSYLIESGSNRVGGLDFQASPTEYVARANDDATLADLMSAAELLDRGEPLPPALGQALLHGSSIGGARPKAIVRDPERNSEHIAKFSSTSDTYPVVKAEALAMHLARAAGVTAAASRVVRVHGRDVLLVERFDRTPTGGRRMMVSLLTLLELDEFAARYASYHQFADVIRTSFERPAGTLRELFRRIVVNVALSNTDDHARNHSAFWDGRRLAITPAYDICPQLRSGGYTEQSIAIGRDGSKAANFATCVGAADVFLLEKAAAVAIVEEVIDAIRGGWAEAVDLARLTRAESDGMWERQVLNPSVFDGWPTASN